MSGIDGNVRLAHTRPQHRCAQHAPVGGVAADAAVLSKKNMTNVGMSRASLFLLPDLSIHPPAPIL